MSSWRDAIPAGAWPRRLPQKMAAAYAGCSVGTFLARVEAGTYPAAVETSPPKWDRKQLDMSFDREIGIGETAAAAARSNDEWLALLDGDGENSRAQQGQG